MPKIPDWFVPVYNCTDCSYDTCDGCDSDKLGIEHIGKELPESGIPDFCPLEDAEEPEIKDK